MSATSQQALPIAQSFVQGGATSGKLRAQGNNSTLFGNGSGANDGRPAQLQKEATNLEILELLSKSEARGKHPVQAHVNTGVSNV